MPLGSRFPLPPAKRSRRARSGAMTRRAPRPLRLRARNRPSGQWSSPGSDPPTRARSSARPRPFLRGVVMRSFLILSCVAVLTAGVSDPAGACSQCMCGTPFPADVLGGVVPSKFGYGLEERYLSKSNALDEGPGVEQEREHRVAAFGLWRPLNQLAFLARVPYNFKEITSRPAGEAASVQRSRGVGDAELLVLAGLARGPGRVPLTLGLAARIGFRGHSGSCSVLSRQPDRTKRRIRRASGWMRISSPAPGHGPERQGCTPRSPGATEPGTRARPGGRAGNKKK